MLFCSFFFSGHRYKLCRRYRCPSWRVDVDVDVGGDGVEVGRVGAHADTRPGGGAWDRARQRGGVKVNVGAALTLGIGRAGLIYNIQ